MRRLIFTEEAESDLEAIGDYIAADNPARSASLIREFRRRCAALVEMPERFPLIASRTSSDVRRCVHGNYLIFYRVGDDAVEILHILHGAMDYEKLLFPEG